MAYNHMVINAQSQSLLVAGESVRRTPHLRSCGAPRLPKAQIAVASRMLAPTHSRLTCARCASQGAGKTETNKQLLNYLIWRAGSVGGGTSTLSQVRAA